MTNQDVINFLNLVRKILLNDKSWLESTIQPINEAFDKAISALQAQDSKTRKICDTCKHDPPSKKWPCMDCDMKEPADRWEPNECQTCKNYDDASEKCGECLELGIDNYEPKEMENSTESSLTQKELDTISRQEAIDATWFEPNYTDPLNVLTEVRDRLKALPSAQPEPCEDTVSRKDAIRWVKTECNPYGKPTLDFDSGKKVIEHLKHMSPVTPKRKTGNWIVYYECPKCGEITKDFTEYCPFCGANMEGSE